MLNKVPVYAVHTFNDYRPPIALGLILANLKKNYPEIASQLDFSPGYLASLEGFHSAYSTHGPGILIFSDYNWNIRTHCQLSKELRASDKKSLILHGGPSIPRHKEQAEAFLRENPAIDMVGHGEGEDITATTIAAYLDGQGYEKVQGLSLIAGDTFIQTEPRARRKDLDTFPSPYLSGEFDELIRVHRPPAITLETTRGCPYKCSFCDWGQATLQKINSFSTERVKAEIDWLGDHEVPVLELADANFGIFDRDVELTQHMCAVKDRTGFPRELATNYAKNATSRVTDIVRQARDAGLVAQGILSLQTRNEGVLETIDRRNLSPKKYDALLADFRKMNLPVLTEIMLGLPGSTIDTFATDLQWACDRNLGVYVHSTILLPNTPMAEPDYVQRHQIVTARDSRLSDPEYCAHLKLKPLRGNQVVSTLSFDEDEFYQMMRLTAVFHMFQGESVLKHVMFFLYRDCGIPQVQFLRELIAADLGAYPLLHELREGDVEPASTIAFEGDSDPLWTAVASNGWSDVYNEVERYIGNRYGITRDVPGFATAMEVQQFVMAYYGRTVPETLRMDYDFTAYYHDFIENQVERSLSSYGPSTLEIEDPLSMCKKPNRPDFYEPHVGHVELASQLTPTRIGFDVKEVLGRPPVTRNFELVT